MESNLESTLKKIIGCLEINDNKLDTIDARVGTLEEKRLSNTNHPIRNSSPRVIDPRDQHDYSSFEGSHNQTH